MAEYVLQVELLARGLDHILVESAGIVAYDGNPAAAMAIQEMDRHGIDMRAHRSRPLTKEMIEEAKMVLVMDRHHLYTVREMSIENAKKAILMGSLTSDKEFPIIKDPYGGPRAGFAKVYSQVHEASVNLVDILVRETEQWKRRTGR